MENLILEFINKLDIKKYLYLKKSSFELFDDVSKSKTHIEKDLLNEKLVEVIDINKINNENLNLIASAGNNLGWVVVDDPIYIYSTFPEKVIVTNADSNNIINKKLNLYNSIDEKTLYTKKYFIYYEETIYIGITKDEFLICFLPIEQISNGDIEPIPFKFKNSRVRLFEDIYRKIDFQFINNNEEFECINVLNFHEGELGSFKNGRTKYWFNLEDTDIDIENDIKIIKKSLNYHLLEHLFYSQNIEKNSKTNDNSYSIEEKVIKDRFKNYRSQIKDLIKENTKLKIAIKDNGCNKSDKNKELN